MTLIISEFSIPNTKNRLYTYMHVRRKKEKEKTVNA